MQEEVLQRSWRLETQLAAGTFAIPIPQISKPYRDALAARE